MQNIMIVTLKELFELVDINVMAMWRNFYTGWNGGVSLLSEAKKSKHFTAILMQRGVSNSGILMGGDFVAICLHRELFVSFNTVEQRVRADCITTK